jgi:Spy/CpxP family protein refolding chaperone
MAFDDPPKSRIRAATALVIVGTFLAGAAAGAGALRWASPRRPPPPPPMGLPIRELGLSVEQEAKVTEITERHRDELDAILREMYPKVRAVNDEVEKEVRTVLTADQQKRLDELKARRPPPMPRGGPPPPGPPPPGGELPALPRRP